jgi:predicted ribosome quality control (RQC) complex YloA/Tae2 family protein
MVFYICLSSNAYLSNGNYENIFKNLFSVRKFGIVNVFPFEDKNEFKTYENKVKHELNKVNKKIEKITHFINHQEQFSNSTDKAMLELEESKKKLNNLIYLETLLKKTHPENNDKELDCENISNNVLQLIHELGMNNTLKSKNTTANLSRLPYYTYTSLDGISIRVGRSASDNDILSCNIDHRDNNDWWLHAAGAPGSHIIIRSHDDNLPNIYSETLFDAALLAALSSKLPKIGRVPITYTRCRNIVKPVGSKPGLVRILSGSDTYTVYIDIDSIESNLRFDRLKNTKQ